ncbi:MAG: DNA translocase FtsK [Spirochaetales bacterium]|nr:DNA translocase FtsK [Spirochaetales bacterium]
MSKLSRFSAILLASAGGLFFLFTLLGALGVSAPFISFLFRTFHLAAFYVPVYLGLCALILYFPGNSEKLLLTMNLSLLPFITLALLLHVLTGNTEIFVSRYLITELGLWISVPFLLLLLLVEFALTYKLGDFLLPGKPWFPFRFVRGDSFFQGFKDKILELVPGKEADHENTGEFKDPYRAAVFEESDPDAGSGVPVDPDAETFQMPDMPEPIAPVEVADDSEIQSLIASVLRPDLKEKETAPIFNPNKTMSIEDVVDPVYEAETDSRPSGLSSGSTDLQSAVEEEVPAVPVAEDPGIGFLMEDEPSEELLQEIEDPEEEPEEPDYEAQGYVTDSYDEIVSQMPQQKVPVPAQDEPAAPLESLEEIEPVEDLPEVESPASIESKLSPEGETEKLGVLSPGQLPRHKRKKQKYEVPVAGLLKEYPDDSFEEVDDFTRRQARALEETLNEFKIEASVVGISRGPVITMFEIQPSPGVKVSRIVNLQDNLALRLAASRIRIVAPIPGKQAIGIEVPNKKRSIVSYSGLVSSDEFAKADYEIPVILGKDISGGNQVIDLARTPHLLIAGSTGSGKSVCVNSLICSILYQRSPRDVKLIMVDPKIVELKLYNDIPHLLTPVITESKKAFQAVQWCLYEMERRYALLDAMGVRDIKSYNKRIKERDIATSHMPYIVLVIDEFADLMATSGKELEGIVARLAAMSRAVGIHLVLATQRPSIDVITGLIKANFPSRIAFMVASKTDSRIIIDMMGAEKLLGKGDMLFTSAWDPFPSRMQGAFLSEDEVERVVSYVKTLGEPEYIDDEIFLDDDDYESGGDGGGNSSFSDPLYDKALDIVLAAGKASASYLQRRLQIGYNRAARLVEEMEIQGIVGPQNGSKPREVVHIPDRPGKEMLDTGE